ncbi:plasmalemma vesicle associated protein b [Heterodontus francisci]|uniref:plasmalemma vesicle associated protein b n=1 Tax=Heterodontus francisci TaxID=7792 RepID=UPI00355B106C
MDHNSYPMSKLGYDSRDYERAKSNSCGSYVKYFLLFTSIIQLLIILGLVLFMTYGNNQSSQQSHLESTQNQSVKFINDINKLHMILGSQNKELKNCKYRSGNLTAQLVKVSKNLQTCITQKNASPNITNLLRGFQPFPYSEDAKLNRQLEILRSCPNLQTNYSSIQRQLADIKAENELQQAKHTLEETKLNSQKIALFKQLEDLRGNCTSMGRDFQKMMDNTKANYETGFRQVMEKIGHYDHNLRGRLEQIRANCTPFSSNFQRQIQQKVDHFDTVIKGMWQNNNEQTSRIGTLEKMNEECKQEAAAQSYQFKIKESEMQEHKEKYLAEKVQLLEERNKLRNQLSAKNQQPGFFLNTGPIKTPPGSCQSEIEAAISALNNIQILQRDKKLLQDRKVELEQQLDRLRKQLEDRTGSCYNLLEEQKRLGCSISG